MVTISTIEPKTRMELVADAITESILKREYIPDSLLPPEGKMCEELGVSRTVVRKAMKILAARGLVHIKQGYGTSVCIPKEEVVEDSLNIYMRANSLPLLKLMEIRIPIEIEIAKLAALRREEIHRKNG